MPRTKSALSATVDHRTHEALRATGNATRAIEDLVRIALAVPDKPTSRERVKIVEDLREAIAPQK